MIPMLDLKCLKNAEIVGFRSTKKSKEADKISSLQAIYRGNNVEECKCLNRELITNKQKNRESINHTTSTHKVKKVI